MRNGQDYVLIGRRSALTLPFVDMQRQFGTALHRVHAAVNFELALVVALTSY
jgi:hypothetical protein